MNTAAQCIAQPGCSARSMARQVGARRIGERHGKAMRGRQRLGDARQGEDLRGKASFVNFQGGARLGMATQCRAARGNASFDIFGFGRCAPVMKPLSGGGAVGLGHGNEAQNVHAESGQEIATGQANRIAPPFRGWAMRGTIRRGWAWLCTVQRGTGAARIGTALQGEAAHVQARQGGAGPGVACRGKAPTNRRKNHAKYNSKYSLALPGSARQGGEWHGPALVGMASLRPAWSGTVLHGKAGHGPSRQGSGIARNGNDQPGKAGPVCARQGKVSLGGALPGMAAFGSARHGMLIFSTGLEARL